MSSASTFHDLCRQGDSSGPASIEAVSQAERELNVVFPRDYREFLTAFGSLLGDGFEIYGLPPRSNEDAPTWQNVVEVNKYLREQHQAGTEKLGFLAISDDGMGIYFFLDRSAEHKAPIWAIGPGVEKQIATNMIDFVSNFDECVSRI